MKRRALASVYVLTVAASFAGGALAHRAFAGRDGEAAGEPDAAGIGPGARRSPPPSPRPWRRAAAEPPDDATARELFDMALATRDAEAQLDLLDLAASRLGPRDLEAALAWSEGLELERSRVAFVAEVVERAGGRDPERALDAADRLLSGSLRRQVRANVLADWLERDLDGAAGWVRTLPEGLERTEATGLVVLRMAPDDPEAALELARGLGAYAGELAVSHVFAEWARRDPVAAAAAASTLPAGMWSRSAVDALAREWGGADPVAALAWARGLGSTAAQQAVGDILLEHSRHDAAAAFRLARETGDVEPYLLETLAARMTMEDPGTAREAMLALPDPELRSSLLRASVDVLVVDDPREAARWAGDLEPGPERAGLVGRVAMELAAEDLDEAASFALGLSGEEQSAAMAGVVLRWADVSAEQAARFVGRLPAGPARVEASAALARVWARQDPAAAARWALSEGGAPEAIEQLAVSWAIDDRDGLERWLEGLPPGEARERASSALGELFPASDAAEAEAPAAPEEPPTCSCEVDEAEPDAE